MILRITCLTILAIIIGSVQPSTALVWIWDGNNQEFTTTLTDGTPIDTTHAENAIDPQIAIDSNGITYIAFRQNDTVSTGIGRIYLSRYDSSGLVTIWDNDSRSWTTTLSDGDPIDTGIAERSAQHPRLAVDGSDRVYVVFAQNDGSHDRIYLSRFDGSDVRIYSSGIWTTDFAGGTPIDADTGNSAALPRLAINSTDQVYVTFYQHNGNQTHIYLCRYDGIDVRIWDNDIADWVGTFADGDPIDTTLFRPADSPLIAIDAGDNVYVAFRQNDGSFFNIYLSRFSVIHGVQIWDSSFRAWTTTLTNGDPVGISGASNNALGLDLTLDSNDDIYLAYMQQDAGVDRIFLSRYKADIDTVQIWSGIWRSDNFALAQPIDTGSTNANIPAIIADSNDTIYVAYGQAVNTIDRIHLSRWNGTEVQIWDSDARAWTATLSDGDPIDAAGQNAFASKMTVDTVDRIYIAFEQFDGKDARIYLSRYDPSVSPAMVEIWDQDAQVWTTTFAAGDPIDAGTGGNANLPQLVANVVDEVFITYYQFDGTDNHIFLNAVSDEISPPITPTPPDDDDDDGGSCFVSSSTGSIWFDSD